MGTKTTLSISTSTSLVFYILSLSSVVINASAFVERSWDEAYALSTTRVAQMTLDQKLGLLTGVGQFNSRCVGNTHPITSSNLSIPAICFQDGPAGLRLTKGVTGFPSGINAASTFSKRLIRARGEAMGEESRGKGVGVLLAPALDIMRNPKAGRAWESFGPDPYLTGEAAFHTIQGIQSTGVQACAKHFVANNQEHWRYGLSANLDERTMREVYGWGFIRSIEAGVTSVMCAYNRVNGTSSCSNPSLLGPNGFLRENGFKGYVISDWGATHNTASTNANAGLEMEQPGDWILIGGGVNNDLISGLKPSVGNGGVSMDRLNEMATKVLSGWFKLGQDSGFPEPNFDAQHSDGSGPLNLHVSVRSDAHTALVREIASASTVLLKNNNTALNTTPNPNVRRGLPVDRASVRSMVVVGQDAKMPKKDCGDLNECNEGTMSIGWGSGSNSLEFLIPPIDALTAFNAGTNVTISTSLSNDLDAGVNAARGKDVAFVFANAMSGELGFYSVVVGNMGDRNDLDLWWKGGSLIERVAAVCSNTIVIIHSVGPVYMPWSTHPNITGILYAGAPGEQTGPALVDVLYGAYNPRGRLPFSIADKEEDYGTTIVYNSLGFPDINYTEKLLLDYRYMDSKNITPRFPFGFGLSYTTFAYSSLSLSPSISTTNINTVTITFTIKNTGALDGTEIPQVYLGFPSRNANGGGEVGEPKRVLRGFEEVALRVGEEKRVSVVLSQREISFWDVVSHAWVVPSGTFTVWVGASINDVRLTGTFST